MKLAAKTQHGRRRADDRRQKTRRRHPSSVLCLLALLLAGCGIGSERKDSLEIELERAKRAKTDLAQQFEQCQVENARLAAQIDALSALGPERSLAPYELTEVRITRYTNIYDRDDDGKRDELVVYFQPIDTAGDVVKAAGTAEVQLWDLSQPADEALLGQWRVDPNELHAQWFSAMLSSSYRLIFEAPVPPAVLAEPLTVRVAFTNYLTGEVFRAQEAINPSR